MTVDLSPGAGLDLPRTDHLPVLRTRLLDLVRKPAATVFQRLYRVHEHGRQHLPGSGPVILAANHLGALDGPLLVSLHPGALALAKRELFRGAVGRMLHLAGQLPVDRTLHDVGAVRRCVQVLLEHRPLVIFPEGRRGHGDMTSLRGGAAYLAMVTGAPIVPVALMGTRLNGADERALPPPGSALHIVYGEQVHLPTRQWPRRTTDVAQATQQLTRICSEHVRWAELTTGMRLPHLPRTRTPHERAPGPGTPDHP
ncbi:lysophospholipid acyltransferase family protein [Aestuariimicrobium ganziense]|uniref:lysophospholipid acyltransferase family protein n=1 Tax=Aestuariimicrobium ganziense TaxID=2773677 RepID=UPI0019457E34|nr:lysophospholipid acyltransferase family protein [Aestuariimicrobium ganziense]